MVNFMPDALKKMVNTVDEKKASLSGDQIVLEYLKKKNYNVISEDAGFEVKGDKDNFLVQVKSSVMPKTPANLSKAEDEQIKVKAAARGYEAWEAKVQLDKKLQLVGDIQWRKIS